MADERELHWVKYYAKTPDGFVREWPSGLAWRTKTADSDLIWDETWTRDRRWEHTMLFASHRFGGDEGDYLVVEVPEHEAELIREMIGVRPRGGPFTPEGQAWLAEHPEDRAAKYLGVVPEYDSARQMVSPRDPTAILARDVPS